MHTELTQRQYDEVIAPHYDDDPQSVIGDSLDRAVSQLIQHFGGQSVKQLSVFDIGVGTGMFLAEFRRSTEFDIRPFGIDLSEKMIDIALDKVPDLMAEVGTAERMEDYFSGESFDLISTHFVTGFVPLQALAPKIRERLQPDGIWSIVGGTKAGFSASQRKANSKLIRWLFGGRRLQVDDLVCNPADLHEVETTLRQHGFKICQSEVFTPQLYFADFDEFLDFAYWGGWLTPFVESMGLHKCRPLVRALLNRLVFPMKDHHNIAIVVAQKIG
jgi:SAM-dependent methyltransferase